MNFKLTALHRTMAGVAVLALAQATHAAPVSHVTTINFATPLSNADGITKAVFSWSSNVTSGQVLATDLVNFSMSLFAGAASIYTDNIIANGVVQPFGTATRTAADPYWNFDLTSNTLFEVRNVLNIPNTTGTQYVIADNLSIPLDGKLDISKYVNGQRAYGVTEFVSSQGTVPEPSTLALIALAGASLAWSRKRAA